MSTTLRPPPDERLWSGDNDWPPRDHDPGEVVLADQVEEFAASADDRQWIADDRRSRPQNVLQQWAALAQQQRPKVRTVEPDQSVSKAT